MKQTCILLLVIFLTASLQAEETTLNQDLITLGIGQQIVLAEKELLQVSIGNPQIAQARLTPDGKQILLTALSPGTTDVVLWRQNGEKKVHPLWVIPGSVKEHAQEIADLLAGMENVRVRHVGERIVIEGKALRQDDLNRISQLAGLYPNVTNMVEMSEEVQPILTEEINRKLDEFGFLQARAKVLGKKIFLSGELLQEEQHQQALKLARMIYADIIDLTRIGGENQPMIRLDLVLMEINRSRMHNLGIRWQDAVQAIGTLNLGGPGANFGLTSGITATFDLIEKKGWGRIITQPSLLCRSGEEANFLAGGEIPIRLVSERTANVQFKPYGIILKMAPKRTAQGAIALRVETEISTLDGSNSVEKIPAFLSRKLTSTVTIASGEKFVLGGLTDQNHLKSVEKLPWLGDIPILGELFKSRNFREGKTELLIFISPQFVTGEILAERGEIDSFQQKDKEATQWLRPQWND